MNAQGDVVGEGWNEVTTSNDPTAHAEVCAIRKACLELESFSLTGCEIYASCEPCSMCLAAIFWARLERVHFAASAEDAKRAGFDDALFYEQIQKPVQDRIVPFEQRLRSKAQTVFDEWIAKPDRTDY